MFNSKDRGKKTKRHVNYILMEERVFYTKELLSFRINDVYHASLEEYLFYIYTYLYIKYRLMTVTSQCSLSSSEIASHFAETRNTPTCYKHDITCGKRNYTSFHYNASAMLYPPHARHFGSSTELRTYHPSLGCAGLLLWNFDAMRSVLSCWRLAPDFRSDPLPCQFWTLLTH